MNPDGLDFSAFKMAVSRQWEHMQKFPMFRVAVEKDDIWATYLGGFPAGTNPIFRERTEHDCSCCKQFIRAVGDTVAVIDGEVVSVWDVKVPTDPVYEVVAGALTALVKSKPIADAFLHYERTAGTDKNFEQLTEGTKTWNHFFVNIAAQRVMVKGAIATKLSEVRADHDVLLRSLDELTDDAIETVLDLIAQNSLYRGEEHKPLVTAFRTIKQQYGRLAVSERATFAWTADASGAVARIRNTAIGTLLVDLSAGVELTDAVKSFESKVAPTNYKRTTALVTPAMVKLAKEKLEALGLTSALERRYATLADITVNNIIFADRGARKSIGGSVFDDLATAPSGTKNLDKIEEVSIDRFVAEIVPRADSIEVLLENSQAGNLVSLIAPTDPTAGTLFKWPNKFSWSYNGEVADSIKERVKKAGGNVTGDLCCRLAWSNPDDLDFHMKEPDGAHIYFASRKSAGGGRLDVDANGMDGLRENPVENIFYPDRKRLREGVYTLFVNQYNPRSASNVGFEAEIDFMGVVTRFAYPKAQRTGENVIVAKFNYSHKDGLKIIESLPSTQAVRTLWGIPSQTFHKVNVLMLSPNHWGEQAVGNKHYFFMLDGCRSESPARGFYNEFLKEDLNAHRKVFEVVGLKLKLADSPAQLSGLGFSSTQRNALVCRVKGSFTRTIKVTF